MIERYSMSDGFIEVKNFLSAQDIKFIRDSVKKVKPTTLPETAYREGDSVSLSEHGDTLRDVDKFVYDMVGKAFQEHIKPVYNPSFKIADTGYEYHRYPAGKICKMHPDGEFNGPPGVCAVRFATVVMHLTTNPDCDLIFPNQGKKIKTEAGKLVVFPPYTLFPHYSTPSTTDREIVMTWLCYDGILAKVEKEGFA